jgi:hypothetical protein
MDGEASNTLPAIAPALTLRAARDERGRFLTGNCGGGRPKGARNRLGEQFLDALTADFEEHGAAAIEVVRRTDPTGYLRIITALVGKEAVKLAVNIENQNRVMIIKDHGTDEKWAAKLRVQQERLVREAAADV